MPCDLVGFLFLPGKYGEMLKQSKSLSIFAMKYEVSKPSLEAELLITFNP